MHASASFFYVHEGPVTLPTTEGAYRERVLPHARKGHQDDVNEVVRAMFGDHEALWDLLGDEGGDWL